MELQNEDEGQAHMPTVEVANRLYLEIVSEGVKQAKTSFSIAHFTLRLSIIIAAIGAFIGLLGVLLVLLGQTDKGAAPAAAAATSSLLFAQRAKEAKVQLVESNQRLDNLKQDIWNADFPFFNYPLIEES